MPGYSIKIRWAECSVSENLKLDIGVYINADDISQNLKTEKFTFAPYGVVCDESELVDFAISQGLLFGGFNADELKRSFVIVTTLIPYFYKHS